MVNIAEGEAFGKVKESASGACKGDFPVLKSNCLIILTKNISQQEKIMIEWLNARRNCQFMSNFSRRR